jgi:hypothetical protein
MSLIRLDRVRPDPEQPINEQTFYWRINRTRYRKAYRREGRYLWREVRQAAGAVERIV